MSDKPRDFPTRPEAHVGFCKSCGTGPLGVRACGECGALLVVCDECDSAWADARIDEPPVTTGTTTLPCPHCGSDLYEPPAHWASRDDLQACQWLVDAIRCGSLILHDRKPPAESATGDESLD